MVLSFFFILLSSMDHFCQNLIAFMGVDAIVATFELLESPIGPLQNGATAGIFDIQMPVSAAIAAAAEVDCDVYFLVKLTISASSLSLQNCHFQFLEHSTSKVRFCCDFSELPFPFVWFR